MACSAVAGKLQGPWPPGSAVAGPPDWVLSSSPCIRKQDVLVSVAAFRLLQQAAVALSTVTFMHAFSHLVLSCLQHKKRCSRSSCSCPVLASACIWHLHTTEHHSWQVNYSIEELQDSDKEACVARSVRISHVSTVLEHPAWFTCLLRPSQERCRRQSYSTTICWCCPAEQCMPTEHAT